MIRRAFAGKKFKRAAISLLALSFALSSTALPSSTNANSITGSSKNACQP
jgi:hypothetical protein